MKEMDEGLERVMDESYGRELKSLG